MAHTMTMPSAIQQQLSIGAKYMKTPSMKDVIGSTRSIHGKLRKRNVSSKE
jgi:hypothetical protein